MLKEVKDLQWKFHQIDPINDKKRCKELMKEYHELNKKLISQGWSITELELMYAEAELEFDSEENDFEVAFVLTPEEFQKITKES